MIHESTNTLIILGSGRTDGNTGALARAVFSSLADAQLVDLNDHKVGPYDYDDGNSADDFLPLAQRMVRARSIVFASPVYWYSMSGQMKLFFDRLTDLTGPYKAMGKALADKTMFAIATGGTPSAPESFVSPFADTAGYFNMRWGGLLYAVGRDGPLTEQAAASAHKFAKAISATA